MGYTIKIGEAAVDWNEDFVRITVDLVSLPHAPAYGEPTDHENQRWPSYSSWSESMAALGLADLMDSEVEVDEETCLCPLMPNHPGAAPITKAHAKYIRAAIDRYKAKHPDHIAAIKPLKPGAKPAVAGTDIYAGDQYIEDPRYDSHLMRGEWLVFWVEWAVENCKHPVLVNT